MKYSIKKTLSPHEWSEYHRIRKSEIFSRLDHPEYDEHHPSLTDHNNYHYVFYVNGLIVGTFQFEILDKERVAIRIISIDKEMKNRGYGTLLLKLGEEEIKKHHVKLIQLHANPKAYTFYKKSHYVEMDFDDPSIIDDNIDMGKWLYHDATLSEDDKQNEYDDKTFNGIELSQKTLSSKTFENCNFVKCNFSETAFQQCRFCDCVFENCNLSIIKVKGCSFNNVEFKESKVVGVNWTEAAWPRIKLTCPIMFEKCDISHSTFFGLNLHEIDIIECKANNVDFRETDLSKSNLTYSDLMESLFINANLSGADFSYAENYQIDITSCKITKAKFMLPEATGLLYGLDIELIDSN